MKIGIYGDSYADPIKKNPSADWMDTLRSKYSDVVTYGVGGSNLYYSVCQFKETHHLFDKKILLVTSPFRVWAKNSSIIPKDHRFLPSPWYIKSRIDFQKTYNNDPVSREHNIKLFEAAIIYMSFVVNKEEEIYKHQLMIKDILSMDPDTILVPCFHFSGVDNVKGHLGSIVKKENKAWNTTDEEFINFNIDDLRNCHMTAENNLIFAEKIIDVIENGTPLSLDQNDFVDPSVDSKEFYIKKYPIRKMNE